MKRAAVSCLVLVLLAACPRAPDSPVSDAGDGVDAMVNGDAGALADAGSAVDAGLPSLMFRLAAAADGGALEPVVIDADARAELEPTGRLVLTFRGRMRDYRVRLFDERDLVLPSDDAATVTDGGLVYQLDLVKPLAPGRSYVLMIDGEVGTLVLGEDGTAWEDVQLTLRVRGERQEDQPRRTSGKKKAR